MAGYACSEGVELSSETEREEEVRYLKRVYRRECEEGWCAEHLTFHEWLDMNEIDPEDYAGMM